MKKLKRFKQMQICFAPLVITNKLKHRVNDFTTILYLEMKIHIIIINNTPFKFNIEMYIWKPVMCYDFNLDNSMKCVTTAVVLVTMLFE